MWLHWSARRLSLHSREQFPASLIVTDPQITVDQRRLVLSFSQLQTRHTLMLLPWAAAQEVHKAPSDFMFLTLSLMAEERRLPLCLFLYARPRPINLPLICRAAEVTSPLTVTEPRSEPVIETWICGEISVVPLCFCLKDGWGSGIRRGCVINSCLHQMVTSRAWFEVWAFSCSARFYTQLCCEILQNLHKCFVCFSPCAHARY